PGNLLPSAGEPDAPGVRRTADANRHGRCAPVFSESRWATPENHQSIIKSLEPPAIALVLGAERLGLGVLADLRRGDVPPGAAAGEEAVFLDLGDDDAGARLIAGRAQGQAELLWSLGMPGRGPEPLGVPGQFGRAVLT